MPLKDLIQNQLTKADLDAISTSLSQIESVVAGKTVNLTPKERQDYGSVNEQNKLFVNKVNELHISQPQFDTKKVDWAEFESDFSIRKDLEGFIIRIASIREQLDDTMILHDNDNYKQSLSQYAYVSYLAEENEPGITTIKEELSQFFPRSSGGGNPPTP